MRQYCIISRIRTIIWHWLKSAWLRVGDAGTSIVMWVTIVLVQEQAELQQWIPAIERSHWGRRSLWFAVHQQQLSEWRMLHCSRICSHVSVYSICFKSAGWNLFRKDYFLFFFPSSWLKCVWFQCLSLHASINNQFLSDQSLPIGIIDLLIDYLIQMPRMGKWILIDSKVQWRARPL